MRVLHLYRPRLPGVRAQAVQVVHTAHALAQLGHDVTLLADRGDGATTAGDALAGLGLDRHPGLDLQLSPHRHSGLAGLWFRRRLAAWWSGAPGLVLARDKRRLVAAVARHGSRHRVVLETHELDSLLATEAGSDPSPALALEAASVAVADALVANCGGTLAAWTDSVHPLPEITAVVHNGTAVRPVARAILPVVLCVGSLRQSKGVDAILGAAAALPLPLVWVGGSAAERSRVPVTTNLTLRAPVPHPDVAALVTGAQCLLVPLADNVFGRQLTSPLKLWDALASGRPIVAPDLPSVADISGLAGRPMSRYTPGDMASLVAGVRSAAAKPAPTPFVRTWQDRAAELDVVFRQVAGSA
jgi:hypothetical protein